MKSALAALLLIATTAHAQSTRYPPQPIDQDQERTDRSSLWEAATNPSQEPYQALIAQAKQGIESRSADQLVASLQLLDQAVALLPHSPEAYRWRGEAQFYLSEWAKCADDLHAAATEGSARDALDKRAAGELQLRLGNCQARAGRLGEAERTFAEAAASGTGNGELLMRLGEVRIAMGKLDEAIAALTAALEAPDVMQAQARLLLASAYDRARRPAEAIAEVRRAAPFDRDFSQLGNPVLPFLGPGEGAYLQGLGWASNEPPRAEYALIYFRTFAKLAPDSPWRKRAEEHLRELKTTAYPESVARTAGAAALDLDAAAAIVRKAMPAMRACAAKTPSAVYSVAITRVGPSGPAVRPPPPVGRYQPRRVAPPPEGVNIKLDRNAEAVMRGDADAAARCIEPLAAKLVLPAIKERDGWYLLSFLVVGS